MKTDYWLKSCKLTRSFSRSNARYNEHVTERDWLAWLAAKWFITNGP